MIHLPQVVVNRSAACTRGCMVTPEQEEWLRQRPMVLKSGCLRPQFPQLGFWCAIWLEMMKKGSWAGITIVSLFLASVLGITAFAATVRPRTREYKKPKSQKSSEVSRRQSHRSHLRRQSGRAHRAHSRHRSYYERFHTSSFARNVTEGDVTAGEDVTAHNRRSL